ncbi:hypothetical protein GLE_4046 [Lysobacter enzymogenes]|uniref:Uncharacterized protein n=1 Tax=Lysobacter enzymogenes TaxID=69 RepID=A0A0S2DLD5_LYSEN|nr:hypothetical protein GLE_4046 [Lysobacter enzymogenes]
MPALAGWLADSWPLAGACSRHRRIDVAPPATGLPGRKASRAAGVGSPTRLLCRDDPTRSRARFKRRRRAPRCRRGEQPHPTRRKCAHASQHPSQRANPSPRNLQASSRATTDEPLESAHAHTRARESKTAAAIVHLSMRAKNFRYAARISCVVRPLENFFIETVDSHHRNNQFFPMATRA